MNENENYDSKLMPLSNHKSQKNDKIIFKIIQEKVLNKIPLTLQEKILLGRDHPVKIIDGYELKSNCVYRAISEELYSKYLELGFVYGYGKGDEYVEYIQEGQRFNNNKGVDWYLGGVSLRYGNVIIECPASKEYFCPAYDNGCHLSMNPTVRHMKSSGYINPVPMSMVRLIKHPNISIDIDEIESNRIK